MNNRPPTNKGDDAGSRARQKPFIMVAAGLAIYFSVLLFGIKVIGDTTPRSSLMAGLIVILAGMGYLSTRRSSARD